MRKKFLNFNYKDKLKSIAVGIPVYNEEKNIYRLLISLANQDIEIKKTIIVNDGSTDKTFEILKGIKDSLKNKLNLEIINLKENKGKANALNIIFKQAQEDYLILLDSDIYFINNSTLRNLLNCFNRDNNIGLVCGWYEIKLLSNFDVIGRVYRFSSKLLESIAKTLNNIYGATGAITALSKDVYKRLILPQKIVREDGFVYLFTLSLGKTFFFCPGSKVMMRISFKKNLKKFILNQARVRSIPQEQREKFKELAQREYKEPSLSILLPIFLKTFIRHPIDGIFWTLLKIISYTYRKIVPINISYKWRDLGNDS